MPREHARILTRVWSDDDFCARTSGAQRLYMLMLSQPSINNAGVLPLTIRRWANKAPDTHAGEVEKALQELEEHFYVVVDRDTEEVMVRSFMRNDGVWKQPRVLKNACGAALHVESDAIRSELAVEFRRIATDDAVITADALNPDGNASPLRLRETLKQPYREAPPGLSDDQAEPVATGYGEGEGVASRTDRPSCVGGYVSSEQSADDNEISEKVAEPHREDVDAVCRHLADRIEGNGSKRPQITGKWRREARLLLDRDKREVEKVHRLIDWCQDHHHWRTRVMAMPKFRSEYDAMRLQANSEHARRAGSRPSASDAAAAQAQSLRRQPRQPPPNEPAQSQLRLAAGSF